MQALSIWLQMDRLEAVQSGLLVIRQRMSERKKPVTAAELEQEFDKQMRLLANAADAAIDKTLHSDALAPSVRAFLTEGLAERMAAYAARRAANNSAPKA